jgi:hypothetical protein
LPSERDKDAKLAVLREIAREVLPRLAPIMRAFREAAPGDPEIAQAWEEYERRYADIRAIVESFAHLLRPGLTVERATDVYWAALDTRTADLFMLGRGWSLDDYADWLADAVDRLLLR